MQHAPEQAHHASWWHATRILAQLLEQALVAGLLSVRIEVVLERHLDAGNLLTRPQNAAAGVMISAPALDNGI